MKMAYRDIRFKTATMKQIETINEVIDAYEQQGYVLTLRQLYYQLVARNLIKNCEREYNRLGETVNDARIAGLIDWDMIEDRARQFECTPSWDSAKSLLLGCAHQFQLDPWKLQPSRVFVIVEKQALFSVVARACQPFHVPVLAAKGYPSASVLREFAHNRIYGNLQNAVIFHLGDHDPSGIDMSRDLKERLAMFSWNSPLHFERLALNMDQVQSQKPPPNPAKTTDSRFGEYRRKYGDSSWELDALSPAYLEQMIANAVNQFVDRPLWEESEKASQDIRERLRKVAADFQD